jgi:hypothetical protein
MVKSEDGKEIILFVFEAIFAKETNDDVYIGDG